MNYLRGIYDHFGPITQAEKLVEECNEIIEAINKGDMENLAEEIADLKLLNNQYISKYEAFSESLGSCSDCNNVLESIEDTCKNQLELSKNINENSKMFIKVNSLILERRINQLIRDYNLDKHKINEYQSQKLKRTLERISTGYYN